MEEAEEGSLILSKEELKRADHLIYVSLKYTRTCDIFKSIIERLMNSIDFALQEILKSLEEEKKISEIPQQPGLVCSTIKQHVEDEKVHSIIDFYLLLRLMSRADFSRRSEFRRHVTMTMNIAGKDVEVNIDNITEYFKRTQKYIEYLEGFLKGELPKEE